MAKKGTKQNKIETVSPEYKKVKLSFNPYELQLKMSTWFHFQLNLYLLIFKWFCDNSEIDCLIVIARLCFSTF